MYANGEGVDPNYSEAVRLSTLAAEQGDAGNDEQGQHFCAALLYLLYALRRHKVADLHGG